MKTAALLGALLLTLFIAPSASHAAGGNTDTVEGLLNRCESNGDAAYLSCVTVIWGVASVMNLNCGYSKEGYSSPEFMKMDFGGVTGAALVQAFKNWARDHPQIWNHDEISGVVHAMSSTFPCKN